MSSMPLVEPKARTLRAHTEADLIILTSRDGLCLDVTSSLSTMLGIDPDDIIGRPLRDAVEPVDAETIRALEGRTGDNGLARTTMRLHHRDGRRRWFDVAVQALEQHQDHDGPVRLFAARDVTDDMVALEHLAEAEQRWRLAFEHSPIGAALVTPGGDITLANASLGAMLEQRPDALAMMSLADVTHPGDVAIDAAKMATLLSGQLQSYRVDKRFVTSTGRVLWGQVTAAAVPDLVGEICGLIIQVQDVTQQREAELELANQALHDPLTGLANRFLVQQWLSGALQEHLGHDVGVLYCDLDRFKLVNDSLGHTAGDDVIIEAAARLRAAVRPEDLVGRVGGDEFVIVCERFADDDDLMHLATRLLDSLDEPIVVGGYSHTVTISIGAATGRSPDNADEVLMRADLALLRAKRLGRARVELFNSTDDRIATCDDLRLEGELRASVGTGQLRAHYQPILTLADRIVVGHEALLRWDHPERGLLSPEKFLDIAETSGLIRTLGWWMLDRACRDAAIGLCGPDSDGGWVAVNASPIQLTRADVFRVVVDALERNQLPPAKLHIEITETAMMQASRGLVGQLRELRDIGVGIVLDDFGTGFSSLSLLRDFPVSMVKIDKSFVTPLLVDPGALAIVRAVLGMCRDLEVPVVAEGVEGEDQASRLLELGCSHVQGFLFGRPRAFVVAGSDTGAETTPTPARKETIE